MRFTRRTCQGRSLGPDHGLQGRRGRAMPASRIEIDQIDCSCHGPGAMHWWCPRAPFLSVRLIEQWCTFYVNGA